MSGGAAADAHQHLPAEGEGERDPGCRAAGGAQGGCSAVEAKPGGQGTSYVFGDVGVEMKETGATTLVEAVKEAGQV